LGLNQSDDVRLTFLIWDGDGVPPKGKWIPVLWRSHGEGDDPVHSIPRLVEEQADALRKRFLAWIYDLGEAQIDGMRLIDHLELRPGFSYWWMTLITEKSSAHKSTQIIDVLKLLALEQLIEKHSVSTIILESGNKDLASAFRRWLHNAGVTFEWRSLPRRKVPESCIKRVYHSLPYPVRAIISLTRYICERWPLKRRNEHHHSVDGGDVTFVDYLIHLDKKALITGRFSSNYWTDLVGILDRTGLKVNWLHHYVQHEAVASTRQAQNLIARFNHNSMGQQFHSCLDGALSISVLLAVLRDYVRLACRSLRLCTIKRRCRPAGSKLDFWPLFNRDWRDSMRGPTAIWNSLCLNLFERSIRQLPLQKLGVYLQENQGWEMAFIHAWRAAGHGQLIGVPHTAVRYWDLRYFYDTRSYARTDKNDLPMPDQVALNGPVSLKAYRDGGHPEDQMVEVEALRYLYLADLTPVRTDREVSQTSPLHVLILGDYVPAVTRRQMQLLSDAAPLLPPDTRFTVKPHPACHVQPSDYPSLHLHMTNAPLLELLDDCDVAYTGNITAAALDSHVAGVPVVSVLDGDTFNMSPLRGMEGAVYITNPAELADALRIARSRKRMAAVSYFCLDRGLPRWRKLLNLNQANAKQSTHA
jgi:surface carbohydrate biosynthesis protein (TIGR04326 family)